jgi:hypothetical protein
MFDLERDLRGYDMIGYLAGKRFFEIVWSETTTCCCLPHKSTATGKTKSLLQFKSAMKPNLISQN